MGANDLKNLSGAVLDQLIDQGAVMPTYGASHPNFSSTIAKYLTISGTIRALTRMLGVLAGMTFGLG